MDGHAFAVALAVAFGIGVVVGLVATLTGCLVRDLGDLFEKHERPEDHEHLQESPR